jgi:hypothetical protein
MGMAPMAHTLWTRVMNYAPNHPHWVCIEATSAPHHHHTTTSNDNNAMTIAFSFVVDPLALCRVFAYQPLQTTDAYHHCHH